MHQEIYRNDIEMDAKLQNKAGIPDKVEEIVLPRLSTTKNPIR